MKNASKMGFFLSKRIPVSISSDKQGKLKSDSKPRTSVFLEQHWGASPLSGVFCCVPLSPLNARGTSLALIVARGSVVRIKHSFSVGNIQLNPEPLPPSMGHGVCSPLSGHPGPPSAWTGFSPSLSPPGAQEEVEQRITTLSV